MTLAQLRDLLTRAHGPAVEREPEGNRSPAGLAHVYLGHEVADLLLRDEVAAGAVWGSWSLVRRVQAVKVALALALGLDPAAGVLWSRGRGGWWLHCEIDGLGTVHFGRNVAAWPDWQGYRHFYAPTVAAEPDAVKALVLAAEHVLATR